MGITAKLRGELVSSAGSARVYSVHERVINLEVKSSDSAEMSLLLSLVTSPEDMTDLALYLPMLPRVAVRQLVTWGRHDPRPTVEADAATPWTGRVGATAVTATSSRLRRELVKALTTELHSSAKPESFRGIILRKDENPFATRAGGLLEDSRDDSLVALRRLIGLGIGFTPSGDDFLTGVLLAWSLFPLRRSTPDTHVQGKLRGLDGPETAQALAKTTAGGRTLVWLALRGRFPAYLVRFGAAISELLSAAAPQGARTEVAATELVRLHRPIREAARTAFAHGESSGMDAVSGFTWALARVDTPDGPARRA